MYRTGFYTWGLASPVWPIPLFLLTTPLHILFHLFLCDDGPSCLEKYLRRPIIVNNSVAKSSVQFSRSVVSNSATPWIAAHQASLSITNSWSSLKLTSIELVMPSSHLVLCHPLLLMPPIPPWPFSNESTLHMRWQSTEVSALASFLPKNTQDWSPLEWTGWISLQSKGLSRVFSKTTVQKHQFFDISFLHSPTLTSLHDYWKNHSLD